MTLSEVIGTIKTIFLDTEYRDPGAGGFQKGHDERCEGVGGATGKGRVKLTLQVHET